MIYGCISEGWYGLRASAYTRNRLNQYTARTVPAAVDVLGVAASGGGVTVNSQAAYRRGEYFWQELAVANASAPVATSLTVSAGGTPTTGKLVTPPSSQPFAHDLGGNLTDDGVWSWPPGPRGMRPRGSGSRASRVAVTWDAENRLVGMQHKTTLADTAARRKLAFEYDWRGRRIRRQVFPWSGGGYGATATSDQRFVYDGWNVVGVFDGGLNLQTAYIWGLDLSGTTQGAGGVGGLLAAITGTTAHFAAYDGNGNVRALADGASGAWSAQYEYGPFGELIRATGPQAKANPFRFSTKWHDDEGDLLYYGYRHYQPGTGRWISRDPVGEEGGEALFGAASNDLLNKWDFLGLDEKGVSERYCDAARKYPQNSWLKCACRVSREIDLAMAGFVGTMLVIDSSTEEYAGMRDRAQWFRCMRSCMVQKWEVALKKWEGHSLNDKEKARLTPAWDKFCGDCQGEKISERGCCERQVEAEQDGMQSCMDSCGKWQWGNSFPVGQMPNKPNDFDFNSFEDRVKYGLKRCCGE